MNELALAFSISNLGPKGFQKILNNFGSVKAAWEAKEKELSDIGIKGLTYKKFDAFRKNFDIVQYTIQLKKENVEFISFLDEEYPVALKKLPDPPIGIFCKGNIDLLIGYPRPDRRSKVNNIDSGSEIGMKDEGLLKIAVVGTRKITNYGRSVTENIVTELADSNIVIVSGLALGVDGLAHRTCLKSDGKTIAVLACGVDCCLPSENYSLYLEILKKNGLIISEYPLSCPPNKGTFLSRNRIVAALSDGILVTEAAEDSGSLVTADWGFKLSKKVFAVPGPINAQMSKGSLNLLRQGAVLVQDSNDVLREFSINNFQFSNKNKIKKLKLSKDERKIVELLENESMTIDEIAKKLNIQVRKLYVSISNLELKGIVKNNSGKFSI